MQWPVSNKPKKQAKPLSFWTKPLGLNLVDDEKLLSPDEYSVLQNFKLNNFGKWVTRDGLKKVSSVTTASASAIKHIAYIPIGSSTYIFLVDANHKIYKCTGSEPSIDPGSAIGTLEGDAILVPFHGYCVILDGSYIKTTQGASVVLAYDDGEGDNGYNYTNLCKTCNTTTSLYSGATTRAGAKFTTQAWTAGYTIPLTYIDVWLSKVGTLTGTVSAKLYDSTGANLRATATTTLSNTDLTTNTVKKRFAFVDAYGMSPSTSYIASIEYSSDDSSNYVKVHSETVASGGDHYYYDGSWHATSTKDTGIGVKPGRPPKGAFGDVKDNRLFVAGDPDHPGWIWYSNVNTVFDWSSTPSILSTNMGYDTDGGGYVSAVDDNANSYPVGGIIAHYGELFVFGKEQQPFISRLTGATPNEFQLPPMAQQIDTDHKTVFSLRNDIWLTSGQSTHNIRGVQEYGDIRTFSPGDPIANKIATYFDSAAFAGYNAADGQYLLKLNGYSPILVCHTANPVKLEGQPGRFPWSTYVPKNLTPTSFAGFNNKFYVGCSNGYFYRLDSTIVKDDGTLPDAEIKSGILELPGGSMFIDDIISGIVSSATATWTTSFYRNGSGSAFLTKNLTTSAKPPQTRIRFSADSIQIKLASFVYTKTVSIKGIGLSATKQRKRGR